MKRNGGMAFLIQKLRRVPSESDLYIRIYILEYIIYYIYIYLNMYEHMHLIK